MAGARPITGVGSGVQTLFGAGSVENTAQGLAPVGIAPPPIRATFVYNPSLSSGPVDFAFDDSYTPVSAANVALDFDAGTADRNIVARGFDASAFPPFAPTAANAAQAVQPEGFEGRLGAPQVYDAAFNGGGLDFAFDDDYTPSTAANVGIYFGGDPLVAGIGLGEGLKTGTPAVRNLAFAAYPNGIAQEQYGKPLVYDGQANGYGVDFTFDDAYSPEPASNTPFNFDGQTGEARHVTGASVAAGSVGTPTAENAAKAAYLGGFIGRVGVPGVFQTSVSLNYGGADDFSFAQSYQPVTGASVRFDFARAKGIAAGSAFDSRYGTASVKNNARLVEPNGFVTDAHGTARVEQYTRYAPVQGFAADVYGTARLENKARAIRPSPPEADGYVGTPAVDNVDRRVYALAITQAGYGTPQIIGPQGVLAFGLEHARLGTPAATLGTHYVKPDTAEHLRFGRAEVEHYDPRVFVVGISPGAHGEDAPDTPFGDNAVSHELRYIVVETLGAGQPGAAVVGPNPRPVAPVGKDSLGPGTPAVDRHHRVLSVGVESLAFGATRVKDDRQHVYPIQLLPATGLGAHRVSYYTQPVAAKYKASSLAFGFADVRLNTRYVGPFHERVDDYGVPGRPFVRDRASTLLTFGAVHDNVPRGALVELTGRAVLPGGLDATVYGDALVAHRRRRVFPESAPLQPVLRWHAVVNAARVLAPFGIDAGDTGRPGDVRNLRRYYNRVGKIDSAVFGTPLVAYRIREISFYQGIKPLAITGARAFNYVSYVTPVGIAPGTPGTAYVIEHFTRVTPRWEHQRDNVSNEGRVRNLTPEITPDAYVMTLFGDNATRLEYRHFYASGYVSSRFGRADVRDRRQRAYPKGQALNLFGLHRVELGDPGLPSPQTVECGGIEPADGYVPRPLVQNFTLYVIQSMPFSKYGNDATVISNGVAPKGILPGQPGIPRIPNVQTVTAKAIKPGDDENRRAARVDPHTVWAQTNPPRQAELNHPESETFEIIDYRLHLGEGINPSLLNKRPVFGPHTRVENRDRRVRQYHFQPRFGGVGTPLWVVNSERRLYLDAVRPFRYGVPKIYGGIRVFQAYGFDLAEYGEAQVFNRPTPDVTRRIYPNAGVLGDVGGVIVSNFHRALRVPGIYATHIDEPERVGPPVYPEPEGIDSLVFGAPWVSNYVRTVMPVGTVLTQFGYTPGFFRDRMTVAERFVPKITGIGPGEVGVPTLSNGTRMLWVAQIHAPDAGRPMIRLQYRVNLASFGLYAGVFGDVDRWEAGKVKPYGPDMAEYGVPTINRSITVPGIDGFIGTPSIAVPVFAGSDDYSLFGPAAVAEVGYACGIGTRAIAPIGLDAGGAGTPTLVAPREIITEGASSQRFGTSRVANI